MLRNWQNQPDNTQLVTAPIHPSTVDNFTLTCVGALTQNCFIYAGPYKLDSLNNFSAYLIGAPNGSQADFQISGGGDSTWCSSTVDFK